MNDEAEDPTHHHRVTVTLRHSQASKATPLLPGRGWEGRAQAGVAPIAIEAAWRGR